MANAPFEDNAKMHIKFSRDGFAATEILMDGKHFVAATHVSIEVDPDDLLTHGVLRFVLTPGRDDVTFELAD